MRKMYKPEDLLTEIFEFVESQTGLKKEEFIGRGRKQETVVARMIFSAIARNLGYSYPAIGRILNRDHTSIMSIFQVAQSKPDIMRVVECFRKKEDKSLDGRAAEKVLGRYAHIYQAYNGKCAVCSFDEVVEVHHVIPRRLGGGDHPSNLVLLCPNHHALVDKGLMAMKDIHLKNFLSPERTSQQQ